MNIRKVVPANLKTLVRPVVYSVLDTVDLLAGRQDPLIPPRRKIFIGSGDFRKVGEHFLHHFQKIGGLRPEDAVLDVGCGIGRMAVPLTGYLSASGRYEGFDIVESGITWCQEKITPRFPNFHFQRADVYNQMYNPTGKYQASEYPFPFEDATFDFVFLTSVFTHMFPEDVKNYLQQITRVLKPGGRCFITYFLWNADSEQKTAAKSADFEFRYERDGCRIEDPKEPEAAVALPEAWVEGMYAKAGLLIQPPIRYGYWRITQASGAEDKVKAHASLQDIIFAVKKI